MGGSTRDAMAESTVRPRIVAGEIAVEGVSKAYGAMHMRKEVVQQCSFKIERGKLMNEH